MTTYTNDAIFTEVEVKSVAFNLKKAVQLACIKVKGCIRHKIGAIAYRNYLRTNRPALVIPKNE